MQPTKSDVNGHILPIINEKAVPVYLVFQGEVKGEVFYAFIVVDLHFGGVLICLKVFDDIREPNGQAIIPADKAPGSDNSLGGEPTSYIVQKFRSPRDNQGSFFSFLMYSPAHTGVQDKLAICVSFSFLISLQISSYFCSC